MIENAFDCPICLETKDLKNKCLLNCTHSLCNTCLINYLSHETNKISPSCSLCRGNINTISFTNEKIYDEFIVDTITYLVQNTLDTDDKKFKSQNLVKIKGNTKASVPIKELTVFQIVVNEDSIAIRLPKPEILSVKIDSVLSQFSTIGDDKILNLSGKVIIEIKDLLQKRAEDHQINSTATLQSINTLGNYYKLLGFRKVYFN
jgi:hypothetical protein